VLPRRIWFNCVRLLYSTLFYALLPALFAKLLWRSRTTPGYRQGLLERLGFYQQPAIAGALWFHAVSVGEIEAAIPIIRELLNEKPGSPILITCTTPTGSQRIIAILGNSVQHVFLPYDIPGAVKRFLDHFRPKAGVIMETEIWPNLFYQCDRKAIPLAIVNGRLSAKSVTGYQRIRGLTQSTLAKVSFVAAQTKEDADRYISLGADPCRVQVTGNVKFDVTFGEEDKARSSVLRAQLFPDRPVLVAGSTHPGEEEALLDVLFTLRHAQPGLLLVIAPRHPQRVPDLIALCKAKGYTHALRSETRPCDAATDVFLVDTLGELRTFYGAANIAFVGGSLVPHGGQNMLEPAVAGIPVLFGPHTANFKEIASGLCASAGGFRINTTAELSTHVLNFLNQPELARVCGERGRNFVATNTGAVTRVIELINDLSGR
jgi:3-deoxy-D-manno-octulosonic-acid transferase